jgi:hypothetical protein
MCHGDLLCSAVHLALGAFWQVNHAEYSRNLRKSSTLFTSSFPYKVDETGPTFTFDMQLYAMRGLYAENR